MLSLSFLINYYSSGTIHREEITPSLGFLDVILYSGYGTIKYLFFDFHKTLLLGILVGIPIYLLGGNYPVISQDFKPYKHLFLLLIISFGSVFINELVVVKALGGLSPNRALISSSIIITCALIRFAFLLGNYHRSKFNSGWKWVIVFNVLLFLFLNTYVTNIHFNYAKAVDNRIEMIRNSNESLITLKTLPVSGYLYNSEISEDPDYFKNQHLQKAIKPNSLLKIEKD